jgi:hypothetical protein
VIFHHGVTPASVENPHRSHRAAVTLSSDAAKPKVAAHHKSTINSAVERWYVEKGAWPAVNLSDIGADVNYFPERIPANPVDNSAYTLNATTHHVN